MAKPYAKKFYNSKQWKDCREGYISSTIDRLCERCKDIGEEVHHKIYITPSNIDDPNITLSWDNLELLCMSCHSKEHMSKYNVVRDGVMFDGDGNLVEVCPH